MEIRAPNSLIELPFSFVLHESLPSTFFYASNTDMVYMEVQYVLNVTMLGLINTGGIHSATILQTRAENFFLRAREPPVKPGITQEQSADLKALIGSNGKGKFSGHLGCDVTMQNSPIRVIMEIDNSAAKKAAVGIKLSIHRHIKATGKTTAGAT